MSDPNNNKKLKYCSYCGSEIRSDAQFCFACGQRFDVNPTSEPKPPAFHMSKREEIAMKISEKKEEIALKLAGKKEQVAAKIAQKKKERVAKKTLRKEADEKKKQEKKAEKKAKKSYRKGIIVGIFISCLVFVIGGFFIIGIMTYGTYEESYTYYYNPASPASIENCNIHVDTAYINIQYNSTPVDYLVKVEADLQVTGLFVSGKKFANFFNPISWENTSSASFSLTNFMWSWIDPTNWIKLEYNVITVTLRTDVVYKISATSITGGVSCSLPKNTTINDLSLNTVTGGVSLYATETNFTGAVSCRATTGGVLLNFTRCMFDGDILGITVTGGVEFNSYEANYTQNINLNLGTTTGGIVMNIQHYSPMGANVTGTASTVTGGVSIAYNDYDTTIGAKFTGSAVTGGVTYATGVGFNPSTGITQNYESANSTYTIAASTTTGGVYITGKSSI